MDAAPVSEAIVVWSGKSVHAWPTRHVSRLRQHFGDERAQALALRITNWR